MIYKRCVDVQLAKGELHLGQFINVHPRGEFTHADGEERRPHRFGHDLAERRSSAIKTENTDFVFGIVRRLKKWEPLDVVPMCVSDQQGELDWARLEFSVESDTQRPNTGARIEHDNLAVCAQLQ